jgi:serine O-acetyltransferase
MTATMMDDPRANPAVSATDPDWSRERVALFAWHPSRRLLAAIRRYQRWRKRLGPIGWLIARCATCQHRFWSAVTGADIPINANLGGGLLIPHPNGIVIHPDATIGPNCLIFQQVTLGTGGPTSPPGAPKIGGHVDIGAGAKILGGITIGPHARIGANAVVLQDIPAGATAVGIPARIIAEDAIMNRST